MKSQSIRTRPRLLAGADSWAERLRGAGLKATGPRLAILAFLEADRSHPSAPQIFAALRVDYPSLSLSTVYETLDAFLEAGICRAVAGEGALLRVDGTTYPHDHAVCRECGRIFDVAASVWPRPDPPQRLPGDLAVTGMRVEYEVICAECAREGASASAPENRAGSPGAEGSARGRSEERKGEREVRDGKTRGKQDV